MIISEERMRIDIVTLFPEMFPGPLGESIIGRAAERKLDEEAARMAAPAEDAFEKEDGHAED